MTRRIAITATLLALSACATVPPAAAPSRIVGPARVIAATNDGVIGQSASGLQVLFGAPTGRLAEGAARKLQFAGPVCVLDAYLYPPAKGGEPAVTHIDTRRPTGEDIDRASCVAALRVR